MKKKTDKLTILKSSILLNLIHIINHIYYKKKCSEMSEAKYIGIYIY